MTPAATRHPKPANQRGAARLAVWIAWDAWAFRGEHAVAGGWLQRARTLLDGAGDVPERAWLELREGALLSAADYIQAQRLRRVMQREFRAIWESVDCLLTPTAPIGAPKVGQVVVHG